MAGGLIQLVATGTQDIFLTTDPQITFFKVVYRRHTNFSMEVIPQNFIHNADFGNRVTCILSRNGDLIRNVHIVIELPAIPQFTVDDQLDPITKFAWVRKIGYAIINTVEIEIGDELIDRHYGDWLNIWYELTVQDRQNYNQLIGNIPELTTPTNGKSAFKLFIPLQFWFNRITGLALPVVSLQYNHIKINLELNTSNTCYLLSPSHTINIDNDFVNFEQYEYIQQTIGTTVSLAKFIYFDIINRTLYLSRVTDAQFTSVTVTDPNILSSETAQKEFLYRTDPDGNLINGQYLITGLKTGFQAMPRINSIEQTYSNASVDLSNLTISECFLLVEYIFLDDEERVKFAQARHEYLIEQVFFTGDDTISGFNQSYKVGFSQACKELLWVSQLSLALNTRNNDWFNYTDNIITGPDGHYIGHNIILNETLLFNGHERISARPSEYFTQDQIYQNHTHSPESFINVYSFCLHPENQQPSGTANLSRIDNVNLQITCSNVVNFNYTALLRIYGVVYNILRVANGISGIVFAIDY